MPKNKKIEEEKIENIIEDTSSVNADDGVVDIDGDESEIDDTIEIDDDDLVFDIKDVIDDEDEDVEDEEKEDIPEEIILSKHAVEGKHSLKYDSIFKGKKEEITGTEDFDVMFFNEKFEVDKSSQYWFESIDNENYTKDKRVKERVYEVLTKHTDINFLNNRRKPSRTDFNQYYFLLKTHLKKDNFTNIELFNELSVYFSDNLFNMFKLLDNKWKNIIITELQDHIGKKNYSNDLSERNLHIGTEIEFEWTDVDKKIRLITGVISEIDYDSFMYKVDSYENIYIVEIDKIKKILNNSKFKYNLNKLNNIDFL